MPVEEVLEEPENIKSLPRVPGTLEIQKLFPLFQQMVFVDEKTFHEQKYNKDGYPDICGHAERPLSYSPDLTCAECNGTYAADQE